MEIPPGVPTLTAVMRCPESTGNAVRMWGSTREKDLVWRGALVWWVGGCGSWAGACVFSSPIIGSGFLEVPASLLVFPFVGSNQGSDVPKCEQVPRGMIEGSTRARVQGFGWSSGKMK